MGKKIARCIELPAVDGKLQPNIRLLDAAIIPGVSL
jgi:hypothetical protein